MRLLVNVLKPQLLLSCMLGIYLATAPAVMADYDPPGGGSQPTQTRTGGPYYRPQRSSPPSGTRTGGRRGTCEGNEKIGLTALAPVSYVGQTSATRPTFAWFMPLPAPQKTNASSPTYSLEFRLYKAGKTEGEPIYKTPSPLRSTPGIMQFSLPQDAPELSIGQRYVWRVIVLCDPSYPSRVSIVQSEFEVVPLSANLKTQLLESNDRATKVNLYAEAGLWYDALGEAIKDPQDDRSRELQKALLADLARSESPGNSPSFTQHRERLQQIITTNFQPK